MNIFQRLWINLQLLFNDYAYCKLFRLEDYDIPKLGMESQGMDIYNNRYIIQGSDNTGKLPSLAIIDIKNKKIILEYELPFNGCHMNNINLGIKLNKDYLFPIFYISECRNKRRCYVVNVSKDLSSCDLIQEIYFDTKLHYKSLQCPFDWIVDHFENYIYTFGMTGNYGEMEICKFRLPVFNLKKRTFTDKDVLDSFTVQNCFTYQGTKIINGKLYAFSGLDTKEYPTYLHIINLQTHEVENRININGLSELEAIGHYEDGFISVNNAYNPTYTFLKIKEKI